MSIYTYRYLIPVEIEIDDDDEVQRVVVLDEEELIPTDTSSANFRGVISNAEMPAWQFGY